MTVKSYITATLRSKSVRLSLAWLGLWCLLTAVGVLCALFCVHVLDMRVGLAIRSGFAALVLTAATLVYSNWLDTFEASAND